MIAKNYQWLRKFMIFVLVLTIVAVLIGAIIGGTIASETRSASTAYGVKVGGIVGFMLVGFPFLLGLSLYYTRLKADEEQELRIRSIVRDELNRQGK
jgi:hypothetical protein